MNSNMPINANFPRPVSKRNFSSFGTKGLQGLNYLDSPQAARVTIGGARRGCSFLSRTTSRAVCRAVGGGTLESMGLRRFGAGTGSVRFICGTFTIHRAARRGAGRFVGTEALMSYVSAWKAKRGLTARWWRRAIRGLRRVESPSIIDSIRLAKSITKCQTAVYRHRRPGRPAGKARWRAGGKAAHGVERRRLPMERLDSSSADLVQNAETTMRFS